MCQVYQTIRRIDLARDESSSWPNCQRQDDRSNLRGPTQYQLLLPDEILSTLELLFETGARVPSPSRWRAGLL
jgi:hypothetical protein